MRVALLAWLTGGPTFGQRHHVPPPTPAPSLEVNESSFASFRIYKSQSQMMTMKTRKQTTDTNLSLLPCVSVLLRPSHSNGQRVGCVFPNASNPQVPDAREMSHRSNFTFWTKISSYLISASESFRPRFFASFA